MTSSVVNPGQIIAGRYRVECLLGQGAMGSVYRALQLSIGRHVALKLLVDDALGNPQHLKRFEREALALSRLTHPNTVRLFDFGASEPGGPFLVMELLRGADLAEDLERQGPLRWDQALRVVREVSGCLAEAHAAGIVHRDIKPANIFLCEGQAWPNVKVLDFGIAGDAAGGASRKLTQTGTVVGSVAYMSPEQAQGHSVGPGSDLYGLGVVLFEALTARTPFDARPFTAQLLGKVLEPAPALRAVCPTLDVPDDVHALVAELLERDPARRPSSAADLGARIEALLDRTCLPPLARPALPERTSLAPAGVPRTEPMRIERTIDDGWAPPRNERVSEEAATRRPRRRAPRRLFAAAVLGSAVIGGVWFGPELAAGWGGLAGSFGLARSEPGAAPPVLDTALDTAPARAPLGRAGSTDPISASVLGPTASADVRERAAPSFEANAEARPAPEALSASELPDDEALVRAAEEPERAFEAAGAAPADGTPASSTGEGLRVGTLESIGAAGSAEPADPGALPSREARPRGPSSSSSSSRERPRPAAPRPVAVESSPPSGAGTRQRGREYSPEPSPPAARPASAKRASGPVETWTIDPGITPAPAATASALPDRSSADNAAGSSSSAAPAAMPPASNETGPAAPVSPDAATATSAASPASGAGSTEASAHPDPSTLILPNPPNVAAAEPAPATDSSATLILPETTPMPASASAAASPLPAAERSRARTPPSRLLRRYPNLAATRAALAAGVITPLQRNRVVALLRERRHQARAQAARDYQEGRISLDELRARQHTIELEFEGP